MYRYDVYTCAGSCFYYTPLLYHMSTYHIYMDGMREYIYIACMAMIEAVIDVIIEGVNGEYMHI